MTRIILLLMTALAFLSTGAHLAYAEEPTEVRYALTRTPIYRPNLSAFEPKLGTYRYTISWQGITAADCEVSFNKDADGNYHVAASAKTYSVIDIFYKLRYRAEGLLSGTNLMPLKTVMHQRENSRVKSTAITFFEDGTIESVRQTKGKAPETTSFKAENFTLDPFAAAFIARSLDWKVGETKTFDTFNGKTRYLITLTAVGFERVKHEGQEREVWVIEPRVKTISQLGSGRESTAEKKLRSAQIYLSADSRREVLKIVSSVFVGSVAAKLESFEPGMTVASAVQVARRDVEEDRENM